jgi:hypothetical protein
MILFSRQILAFCSRAAEALLSLPSALSTCGDVPALVNDIKLRRRGIYDRRDFRSF